MSSLFDYGDDANYNKTGFISEISSIYINLFNIVNLKVKTFMLKFDHGHLYYLNMGMTYTLIKTHFISEISSS